MRLYPAFIRGPAFIRRRRLIEEIRYVNCLKFLPGDEIFGRLKKEITPHVPGLRTLCPTRWTVRAASLESIRHNYPTLMATWEEALDVAKRSELKARINGVYSSQDE